MFINKWTFIIRDEVRLIQIVILSILSPADVITRSHANISCILQSKAHWYKSLHIHSILDIRPMWTGFLIFPITSAFPK